MREPSRIIALLAISAAVLLPCGKALAGVPPGPILRPAGLQWYVRGAHNSALNEYFVVWADAGAGDVIRGFRLTATGARHPTDPAERLISDPGVATIAPDIAYNPNANEYLVVWADGRIDNGDIWARFVNGQGTPIGTSFLIFQGQGNQTFPRVAYNPVDNLYMVVWQRQSNLGANIGMQMISGNSAVPTLIGSFVQLEAQTRSIVPHSPQLAWNEATNAFFVAWSSLKNCAGNDDDLIRGQIFNGDGTAATGAFILADTDCVNDKVPSVAANSKNGEFLITYDRGAGGGLDLYGVMYNSNGTMIKAPFPISTTFKIPDWRSHAGYNERANSYVVTFVRGRGCGGPACDDVLARTIAPDGTLGPEIGIADAPPPSTGLLETHGVDDANGSWGDLVSSESQPDFLDLYQVDNDDLNGGVVSLTPPPFSVSVSTNQSAFTTGETLITSVDVFNPGTDAITVDFYFGVLFPDGDTIVFFTDPDFNFAFGSLSSLSTLSPIVSGVDLSSPFTFDSPTFFQFTWPADGFAGLYSIFVAAILPGALADNSVDPGDIISIDIADVSFTP